MYVGGKGVFIEILDLPSCEAEAHPTIHTYCNLH
jgi:hypothetical protein